MPLKRKHSEHFPTTEHDTTHSSFMPRSSMLRRSHEAIPWISYDETTQKYTVNARATQFLEQIEGPLAVVSIVGLYRTGKSYLLNRGILEVAEGDGFQVSPTINSCTKGLWLYTKLLRNVDGHNVLIVDTEGIGALDRDSTHDARVFSLALLLSSYFIYNSVGNIDESALSNLGLVANIASHIASSSSSSSSGNDDSHRPSSVDSLGQYFPSFMWVVRDFSLELVDRDDRPITSRDYLENALCAETRRQDSPNTEIRRLLRAYFPQRDCVTMVRPCSDEQALRSLSSHPMSDLRSEFVAQLKLLRTTIRQCAKPATAHSMTVTGVVLSKLATSYTSAINLGRAPVIRDTWTLVSADENRRMAETIERDFLAAVGASTSIPSSPSELSATLEQLRVQHLCIFSEKCMGDEEMTREVRESLNKRLTHATSARVKENDLALIESTADALSEIEQGVLGFSTLRAVRASYTQILGALPSGVLSAPARRVVGSIWTSIERFYLQREKKIHSLEMNLEKQEIAAAKTKMAHNKEMEETRAEFEAERRDIYSIKAQKLQLETQIKQLERKVQETNERAEAAEAAVLQHQQQEQQRRKEQEQEQEQKNHQHQQTGKEESGGGGGCGGESPLEADLAYQTVRADDLQKEVEKMQDELRVSSDALNASNATIEELQREVKDTLTYKMRCTDLSRRLADAEAANQTLETRVSDVERKCAKDAEQFQAEAMHSLETMKQTLKKERDRAARIKAAATKESDKIRRDCNAKLQKSEADFNRLQTTCDGLQKSIEDNQSIYASERESLNSEVDRYSALLTEQKQLTESVRKDLLKRINDDASKVATREASMETAHKSAMDDARGRLRSSELKLAGASAKLDAANRRVARMQADLEKARTVQASAFSKTIELTKLQTELDWMKQEREKSETAYKTTRDKLKVVQQQMLDIQSNKNMEITRTKMAYERRISVLEQRCLDME